MSDYIPNLVSSTLGLNAELTKIAEALKRKVSRTPAGDRSMLADLDMNSNRVLNLPKPTSLQEPLRLADIANVPSLDLSSNFLYSTPGSTFLPGVTYFDESRQELAFSLQSGQLLTFPLNNQWHANLKDYGATLDGVADDTDFLERALADSKEVIVPPGCKIRITRTVTIPRHTVIRFLGGTGNTVNQLPASYVIKASTLNGPAIRMLECSSWYGGGVLGEVGNTGDGIICTGNSITIDHVFIARCGRDGLRIGDPDGVYYNCNSAEIRWLTSCNNGRHGFYAHDAASEPVLSADANAGDLYHAFCYQNGSDGIHMGRAWWWTVVNPLTEGNGRDGMFVDDTKVVGTSGANTGVTDVERCRYLQIFGGDFNEGNARKSLYFGGYCCVLYMSTANQVVEIKGTFNNVVGGAGENVNWGQTINRFLKVDHVYPDTGVSYPVTISKPLTGTPGDGVGISFQCDNLNVAAPPYQNAAAVAARYRSPGMFELALLTRRDNELIPALVLDPQFRRIMPGADLQWGLGTTNQRFNLLAVSHPVYANDAAAIAGGLTAGCHYHNGDGIVRVVRP